MAKDDKIALNLLREQLGQLKQGLRLLSEKAEQQRIDFDELAGKHAELAALVRGKSDS